MNAPVAWRAARYRGPVTSETSTAGPRAVRLVLVGPMGAGKSTVAAAIAARTGRRLVDLDAAIVAASGRTVPELFATDGESAFRELEHRALAEVLATDEPIVVATGGGAVTHRASRRLLAERALVVWLRAEPGVLLERIGDPSGRPLLEGADPLAALTATVDARAPLYAEVADLIVDVDHRSVDEVASSVLELLGVAA